MALKDLSSPLYGSQREVHNPIVPSLFDADIALDLKYSHHHQDAGGLSPFRQSQNEEHSGVEEEIGKSGTYLFSVPEQALPTPPLLPHKSTKSAGSPEMCYTSTPIHSCGHFGPLTITSACVCGTSSRACHNAVDTGCRNVETLCPTCVKVGLGMRGVQGLGLMGMLNAIDVAVSRATSRSSGSSAGSTGATPPSSGAVTPALTDASSSSSSGVSTLLECVAAVPVLELAVTTGGEAQDAVVIDGVPDLGFLGDLGEPECANAKAAAAHGKQTVQTFNLHWRAFAQRNAC